MWEPTEINPDDAGSLLALKHLHRALHPWSTESVVAQILSWPQRHPSLLLPKGVDVTEPNQLTAVFIPQAKSKQFQAGQ